VIGPPVEDGARTFPTTEEPTNIRLADLNRFIFLYMLLRKGGKGRPGCAYLDVADVNLQGGRRVSLLV